MRITIKESLIIVLFLAVLLSNYVSISKQTRFQRQFAQTISHERAGEQFATTALAVNDHFERHNILRLDRISPRSTWDDTGGTIEWTFDYTVPELITNDRLLSVLADCIRPFKENRLGSLNPNQPFTWNVDVTPNIFEVPIDELRTGEMRINARYWGPQFLK